MSYFKAKKPTRYEQRLASWNRTFSERMATSGNHPWSEREYQHIDETTLEVERLMRNGSDEEYDAAVELWLRATTPIDDLIDLDADDPKQRIVDWATSIEEYALRNDHLVVRIERCKAFGDRTVVLHTRRQYRPLLQPGSDEESDWKSRLRRKGPPKPVGSSAENLREIHLHVSELPHLAALVESAAEHGGDPEQALLALRKVQEQFEASIVDFREQDTKRVVI